MELLKNLTESTAAWLITGVVGPAVVAAFPSLRKWLAERPAVTAALVGGFASTMICGVFWTVINSNSIDSKPEISHGDPKECKQEGDGVVCTAECKGNTKLISGSCNIRGSGIGGTGYIQNIGFINTDTTWTCTWQPLKGMPRPSADLTEVRVLCAKKGLFP